MYHRGAKNLNDRIVADMRSQCPAIDRRCGEMVRITLSPDNTVHRDSLCGMLGQGQVACDVPLFELLNATLCRSCGSKLADQVRGLRSVVSLFHRLCAGPQPGWNGYDPVPAAVVRNAITHAEDHRDLEDQLLYADDADELVAFAQDVEARWTSWFETTGAEELLTVAGLAGPDAVATRDGIEVSCGDLDPTSLVSADDFAGRAFWQFAAAQLSGPEQARDIARAALLAKTKLFHDDVINAEPVEVAELLADGLDLHGIVERVRADRRRRDVDAVLDLLEARVLPVDDVEQRVVVVVPVATWREQFWASALSFCYPNVVRDWSVVLRLPKVLADIVVRSALAQNADPVVVGSHCCVDEATAGELVEALGALLSDGLSPGDALATAAGVLS